METVKIFELLMDNPINDVAFSGGEPFFQHHGELLTLASALKGNGKNIWCYTGYKWEELIKVKSRKEVCEFIDVIVDGPYILERRDLNLQFRGSSNQRLIDCAKSLAAKQTVLIEV